LRLAGVVRSPVIVWNDFKLLSLYQRYPWEHAGFRTPLPAAVRQLVTAARRILPWTGWVSLPSASVPQARADRELVERALRPLVETWVVSGNDGVFNPAGAGTHFGDPQTGGHFGVPTEASVRGIYWRKKSDPTAGVDLDRDGCGKLTLSVAVPFEGGHVRAAVEVMEEVISGCGFEPFISVVGVAERHAEVIAFVVYDREVEGEDDRALACYRSLLDRLQSAGFIPDRVGIQAMGLLPTPADDYAKFCCAIKRAVDPNGILAPGRYDCPDSREGGRDNSAEVTPAPTPT
jgi:4-cresol dehydrogenase (hydroxylating)